jgi:LysM repeat protein
VPRGKEAGDYTVWYMIDGGNNYDDVAPRSITVTIASKPIPPAPEPAPGPYQMPEWYKWKKQDNSGSEDEHSSSGSNNTKTPDGFEDLRELIVRARKASETTGKEQTVYWSKGTSLPYDVMKMLADNPKVTLVFSYKFQGYPFTVNIPGKNVIANPSIPWYGPVYLFLTYGNRGKAPAITQNPQALTGIYTIKKGDTLSKIARKFKVTVDHLKTVNNIENADKIKSGMVLRY